MNKKRVSKEQYYKRNENFLVNFDEKKDAKSYFSYNPTTKIATAVYYARTPSPVNIQSSKPVRRALNLLFSVNRCICVVNSSQKSSKAVEYISIVEYYFRSDTLPDINKVVTIPKIIQDNVILQEFLRTDAKTGEVQIVPFSELPSGMPRYNIIKYCNTQNAVKRKIKGGYWAFA